MAVYMKNTAYSLLYLLFHKLYFPVKPYLELSNKGLQNLHVWSRSVHNEWQYNDDSSALSQLSLFPFKAVSLQSISDILWKWPTLAVSLFAVGLHCRSLYMKNTAPPLLCPTLHYFIENPHLALDDSVLQRVFGRDWTKLKDSFHVKTAHLLFPLYHSRDFPENT